MKRPRSAVYMSIPYNFSTKEEALEAKKKLKETLNETAPEDFFTTTSESSHHSYKDSGPSIFNCVKKSYSTKKYSQNKQYKRLRPCREISSKSIERST